MNNGLEQAEKAITEVCETLKASDAIPRAIDAFRDFLLAKNKAYGNSIYEPVRVFTNASIDTLILVRLNDKATRLLKGESGGEDSFDDLLGYLILRKALPLYLTFDTKEGQDALDLLPFGHTSKPRMVPHSEVQAHLAARGLRVGMTFAEVRDNPWTQCEATQSDADGLPVGRCTEGDPCPACKFLDGALCTCGHPFLVHDEHHCIPDPSGCYEFSLASWTNEPIDPERDVELEGMRSEKDEADAREALKLGALTADWPGHSQGVRTQSEERNRDLAADAAQTKTPRIKRATWHETAGAACIGRVLGLLRSNDQLSWAIGELAGRSGFAKREVGFALRHLIETGAAEQHGKAKGTRYAAAGFTDWPAPLPRGKKQDDQFADEEPSIIIGAHGAT